MMTADEQMAVTNEIERFARERGIGLIEAITIIRLVMELLDLPQVKELIEKIKQALND